MNNLISVIIPTYNRHHKVLDAIQSVKKQTYLNWELVVVDDCSTDQTQSILENRTDIRYIRLPQNKGNAGARNEGVRNAEGEYIVFLDSDDFMEPNCLELFAELLSEKPETKFAFGGYYILNSETGTKTRKIWKPDPSKSFLRELKIGTGCGLMVQKQCFETIGYFDERLRVAVDTDWLIRLEKEYTYEIIEECLVTVIKHPGERVRNNKSQLLNSYEIILDKNKKDIYADPAVLFKFLYKLQWLNYQSGYLKKGNKLFIKQLKYRIAKTKTFFSFLLYNLLPTNIARNIHNKMSGSTI